LRIGAREINDQTECYVIAEIGHNHQGSVAKAKELFKEAKLAGAHAVKLQKRDNRGLYTRAAYDRPYDNENSFGATYGEHREFLEFGLPEYTELQAYARELGVDFFSTAFDTASADFLEALDIPVYKLASGDLKSTPLLKHVARFGKPMIISTGGALIEDVQRAYDTIMPINPQLAILQCTAGYPAAFE
jgi:N-acetylneuraminate synthase/sialic acid synthase